MAKYLKLGSKAQNFFDPISGLNIVGKEVVELPKGFKMNPRINRAISGGHLVNSNKDEYLEYLALSTPEDEEDVSSELGDMTKSELVDYYKENYEVSEEDLEKFEKLTKAKMVNFLEN